MFKKFITPWLFPDYYYGESFDTLDGEKTEMFIDIGANPTILITSMRVTKNWHINKLIEVEVYL